MRVLVTGSSGLIGSEAVAYFCGMGFDVVGVDNNMRASFFGARGDTSWNRDRLLASYPAFRHVELDIRDRAGVEALLAREPIELVVHAAAQPSHDLAASRPFDDFDVNAGGTLNLLEAVRRRRPGAVFCHLSTNKVYGDGPNQRPLVELETRYDFADAADRAGIGESFPIDQSLHSLFGASKAAADLIAQEYGRYFGLNVGVFRGGCLTGPAHSGVELHGFLNYLVRTAVAGGRYTIFGYKGKQVRDQIHAHDVIDAIWRFAQDPRPGEVYNIGGGPENAASVLECIELIERLTGRRPELTFSDEHRVGDHICYYTDLSKLRSHFPGWTLTRTLPDMIEEIADAQRVRVAS